MSGSGVKFAIIPSALRSLVTVVLCVLLLSSCTAMTGKTAGQNVDDAAITASSEGKACHPGSGLDVYACVGVNTDRGIVHLDGIVPTAVCT